jgi:hypothetical protein
VEHPPSGNCEVEFRSLTSAGGRCIRATLRTVQITSKPIRSCHGAIFVLVFFSLTLPREVRSDLVGLVSSDWAVRVTANVSTSPPQVQLNWAGDPNAVSWTVSRKPRDSGAWQDLATLEGNAASFTDSTAAVGVGYDYKIVKTTNNKLFDFSTEGYKAYGYIYAGIDLPLVEYRGKVIVLVESSVADALKAELDRLEADLVADGWGVVRATGGKNESVTAIKARIQSLYAQDPANTGALLLLGNIPVPYSGDIAPDEHPNHTGAWPADVYYGDMDGLWTDSTVNDVQAERLANHNVPGDGKFDQNEPPSAVELAVGRVDLSNMTCYANKTPSLSEIDLLRRYLDKNHKVRSGSVAVERTGIIYDMLGTSQPLPEPMGAMIWRNFTPLLGDKVVPITDWQYHTLAEQGSYLWSMAASWGDYDHCSYIGSADEFALRSQVNVVFTTFCGSYFGDWNNESAYLRAALGAPGTLLTTCYAGKPQWIFQHMALGETIGFSTRVTQQNGPNGPYLPHAPGSGQVHISLLGDPTLREQPLSRVQNFQGRRDGTGLKFTWDAPAIDGLQGYAVYKASNAKGPYQRVNANAFRETSFTVPNAAPTDVYMVKPIALSRSPSGTYLNSGPGVIYPDPSAPYAPPSAIPQAVQGTDGEPLNIVLGTSGGAQGAVLSYTITSPPSQGQLSGTAPNLTYTAVAGRTGTDQFSFAVSDGIAQSSPATVTIQVTHVNHQPTAGNVVVRSPDGGPVNVTLIGNDLDGDPLTFHLVTQPQSGQLSGTSPNLVYTPVNGASGTDSFLYDVSDGTGQSLLATVTIQIAQANRPPSANNATVSGTENMPVPILLSGKDPDGDTLTFQIASPPTKGQLAGNGPNLTYTPAPGASGGDSFTFVVSDGVAQSAPAIVSIQLAHVNRPPIATAATVRGTEGAPLNLTLAGTDPDNDPLVFQISSSPGKGQLSGVPPNVTYTPGAGVTGTDSFTFVVSDGLVQSSPATVTIQLAHQNHPPTAASASIQTSENTPVAIILSGTDPDGDALSFQIATRPGLGQLSGNPPNLTYTPASNASGTDTFTFVTTDGIAQSAAASITVQIARGNQAPTAASFTLQGTESAPVSVTLKGADPDGDPLTFEVLAPPSKGSLSGTAPILLYTPRPGPSGVDSFSYRVSDGLLLSAPATVTIELNHLNQPPIIGNIPDQTISKNRASVPIVIPVSDADSAQIAISATCSNPALIPPSNVQIVGKSLVLTPARGATGITTMLVHASDGETTTDGTFQVTIVNSPPVANGDQLTSFGESTQISSAFLTANDSDADDDTLTIVSLDSQSSRGGTVSLSNGTITYVAPGIGAAADEFRYTIEDTSGATASAIVHINSSGPKVEFSDLKPGAIVLKLSGKANAPYQVFSSPDLVSWSLTAQGTSNQEGQTEYALERRNVPALFYRVIWP